MNAEQFFHTVERMRLAQQEYGRMPTSANLTRARQLEKEIDKEIKRVREVLTRKQNPKIPYL